MMTHLIISTPCYGGLLSDKYVRSLLQTVVVLERKHISFSLHTFPSDSLITRARNIAVANFLVHKESTHMIFIDADIEFPADSISRMLDLNVDVICGIYPTKKLLFDRFKDITPGEPIEPQLVDYAFAMLEKDRVESTIDKCISVSYAGTGFMMIKRQVFQKMMTAYPELKCNDDGRALDVETNQFYYTFFDTMLEPETRRYLGEDFAFCHRWRHLGGQILVDLTIKLNHLGIHKYQGDPMSLFTLNTI